MEKTDNISSSKNKLVFEQENSSDDEVDHVEKKIKVVKTSPVRLETIFTSYQCKEYEICLKMIDEVLKQKLKEEQMEDPIFTQCRIVQAACWTLTNTNKVEARDQLTKILATEPKNSFAHYGFGLYHYHEGNMEAAIESFGRALSFDPSGEMMKALEFKAKSKGIMDMLYNGEFPYIFHLN